MKKLLGVFVILSVLLALGIYVWGAQTATKPGTVSTKPQPATTAKPLGPCCIAGKYEGVHKDSLPPSKTCPKPESGKFVMQIMQDKGCGQKILGIVINPKDGSKRKFEGKVVQRGICCYIEGIIKKPASPTGAPGEETKFWGTLCKKGDKFVGDGEYSTSKGTLPGCKGTWEMKQM
jgi:hypothetical protein